MRKPRAAQGAQAAAAFSSRFPENPLDQPHGNAVAALERLRRRADFLRAAKGIRVYARGLTVQAAPRPILSEAPAPGDPPVFGDVTRTDQTGSPRGVLPCAEAPPRFGFTVTKQSGGAVQRNRIRRRLKEALRLLKPLTAWPGHDYVILARPEALGMPFLALQGELIRALGKIAARTSQRPPRRDDESECRAAAGADEPRQQRSKGRKSKG